MVLFHLLEQHGCYPQGIARDGDRARQDGFSHPLPFQGGDHGAQFIQVLVMLAILFGEDTPGGVEHGILQVDDGFLVREIIGESQVSLDKERETP